ncbi:MAG: CvpA family protein [Flavobacterium sp.]|nr:CvpA family protein [Pedobacter sp.]
MNYIDLLLLTVIVLSALAGSKNGFILTAIELIGWTGSLLIGFFLFPHLSSQVLQFVNKPVFWITPLIFIISIVLARIPLSFLLNNFLNRISPPTHQHFSNKFLGVIPGFINGVIFAALLAIVLSGIPLGNSFSGETQNSALVYKLTSQTKWIENKIRPVFTDLVINSGNIVTIHPETNKLIKLPFKVSQSKPRPSLEAEMLVLINKERESRKLKPLKADPLLRYVARRHSTDMFKRGYFSHHTPEGKDPFDRIREAKISFITAGENLALSPTLKIAHYGLMESPGHKANILHPDFGKVGIGIMDGGTYGIMVTQNFRN